MGIHPCVIQPRSELGLKSYIKLKSYFMENDKIIFYLDDKLNLYYIPYVVRNFKVNARNKL